MNQELKNAIVRNIERIMNMGASYVDVRFHEADNSETLVIYDGNLEGNDTTYECGVGVRVLFGGAWGFAATSNLLDVESCFDRAYQNSSTASKLVKVPLSMGKKPAHKSAFKSPVEIDPFTVPLKDKLDFLVNLDNQIKEDWIVRRYAMANFQKKKVHFFNSEGTEFERDLSNTFASMSIMALDSDGQIQERSCELFTTGKGTRGWEMLTNPELFAGHADRIKSELSQLIKADSLEYGKRSVILLPGQGYLQVHETIGHPLELDRILGYELSYAGGSFVNLDSFGKLQYGSEKLNVSAFGGIENSPGSFGFDDEGSPERNYMLIEKGKLVNCLTSRAMINEANERAGRQVFTESGGAARATAFYRAPIDRMTNVNIEPGNDGTLEDIIANTENGIVVDNPVSWSIGSNREHFHFGCEIAWEIKDGKRTRILKNPTYQGHTIEFYNNLSAVGDERTWMVGQVNNCGKGEPNQVMQLGHGIPVVKFDNVITGEKE
ncbi:MAG: TldD/PmbA family protein [Candidatus Delongbacteria bacterium]|nr:TldD/PmbA family protein [Candidatus Delongbacteria bacterium]MBN2833430.1 TldD/PmbA family protein [Candidatus Delongbacteria bacterium]